MKAQTVVPIPEEPCHHMEQMLNRAADGSSKGLILWLTLMHAARCNRCYAFLQAIRRQLVQLRHARTVEPAPDVLERLTALARAAGESAGP